MTTPPPVDLSRLGSILGNAKAVMNKVEKANPKKQSGQIQESYDDFVQPRRESREIYNESDEKEMNFENFAPSPSIHSYNYSDEQVANSKLPEAIKKAMIESRIPKFSTPPSKFTAEEIAQASGIKLTNTKTQLTENVKKSVNQGDMITISRTQLNEMVNSMVDKKLLEYFTKSYNKLVTQETVKATIKTLINEGKIVSKTVSNKKSV